MNLQTPSPPQHQSRRSLIHVVAVGGVLIVAAILLFQFFLKAYRNEKRQIAYAATATALFHPTPTHAIPPTIPPLPTNPSSTATVPVSTSTYEPSTPIQQQASGLVNLLLLGSDFSENGRAYRTDVIILVSVNLSTQTVNVLSIPRDLYVEIPGLGMERINAAELYQTQIETYTHPLGLLAETIEYNFGIQIDHIVRVNFDGFRDLIDILGGISIPVDCPISGYQLIQNDDGSSQWQMSVLEPGIHNLNGELTLWYARQRIDSSDFERNRRQQIILWTLWQKLNYTRLDE